MRGLGVWRALDRARALNLGSRTPLAPTGVTRRRVLAALGAGTVVAFTPSFARSPARRVAVIGGGLAGLTALTKLRAGGADAVLFEARGAVGGRTRSVRGVFAPDFAFDEGGQLINSDHRDMIDLANSLGLKLLDRQASGPEHEVQIGAGGAVDERALAEELRAIAAQITRDSDRLDADYDSVAREIDALSVAQYLDMHGLRPGDARNAIEATIHTEYGCEPDQASALELLFNLPTVDGERVTRLSLADERYLVDGGAGQIAQRLGERMKAHVRLNSRVKAVDMLPSGVRVILADGRAEAFDRVIVAVPASLVREIAITGPLSQSWRDLIAEIDLGKNEKVIVGYEDCAWRNLIGTAGTLWASGPFSEGWDAASCAQPTGPGAFTYYLGGDQVEAFRTMSGEAAAERLTRAAQIVMPQKLAANGRIRRTAWCSDPMTKGAYINFRPGQLTRFGELMTLEEDGKVRPSQSGPILFAGEWLSDAWPGYMNGAAQTGRIAADAALMPTEMRQAA
jgi:monoamine oxidase